MMKTRLHGLLFAIAGAAVWTFALLYSQNNLLQNKNWLPLHASSVAVSTDGFEQLISRSALASFRLNSGYFGLRYQLISRSDYSVQEISAEGRMSELTMVTLGIVTQEGATKVRFSSNPTLPSLFYTTDKNERMLNSVVIPDKIPKGAATFRLKKEGQSIRVFAGEKEIYHAPANFTSGKIFVDVYEGVVEKVEVNSENLSFKHKLEFFPFFWPLALVLCALGFYSRKSTLLILILGVLWSIYDYTYYSKKFVRFQASEMNFESFKSPVNVEGFRGMIFERWFRLAGGDLALLDRIRKEKFYLRSFAPFRKCEQSGCRKLIPYQYQQLAGSEEKIKILMIGGSLIGGWGTIQINDYYPFYIQRFLKENLKKETEIVTLSGFVPTALRFKRDDFRRILSIYKPHVIVLEFQTAMIDLPLLMATMATRKEGMKVFAVLAPQELSHSRFELPEDQNIIPIIRKSGVTIIDSNKFFHLPENYLKKVLFIDNYHLNKDGHEEMGRFLGEQMLSDLKTF
ncbi:MAG: SGNH/GDSL hydrolase family protein [Bdellovibrionota bacterium]